MPAFVYKSILLNKLPDGNGWLIIGVKHNRDQETIATLMPVIGQELARRWADQAAKTLARNLGDEVD